MRKLLLITASIISLNTEAQNIGIGTTTPVSKLSVGSTSQFQVDSNGNIKKINNVAYSFPFVQGFTGQVLSNNGSGILTWTTAGTVNGSGSSYYIPKWSGSTALGNSLIYDNGTSLGIGTTSPANRFEVQANASSYASIYGYNSNSSGTGIIGSGNSQSGYSLSSGSGGAFTGVTDGLFVYNTSSGVFESIYALSGSSYVRVNFYSGSTQYKIYGSGTVSTIADGLNGEKVTLHCPETPEIYFEDYGEGKLVNGQAHIDIDPLFAKNITINERHPLRAYIQLEGDCNGVYISNKSTKGFDVLELNNGKSNVHFQWHIVCNRADEVIGTRVSKNADIRFELAPSPKEINTPLSVQK